MFQRIEERLAEEHRNDILREVAHLRLEEQALKSRPLRSNWFARIMQQFGRMLIARGEGLVRRYENPGDQCQPSNRSYAING